jgi:hypothetical protein
MELILWNCSDASGCLMQSNVNWILPMARSQTSQKYKVIWYADFMIQRYRCNRYKPHTYLDGDFKSEKTHVWESMPTRVTGEICFLVVWFMRGSKVAPVNPGVLSGTCSRSHKLRQKVVYHSPGELLRETANGCGRRAFFGTFWGKTLTILVGRRGV